MIKTLDELSSKELNDNKEKIIDSLIYFYDTIAKVKTNGYGLLDKELNGTSKNFKEFIVTRQTATQNNLSEYQSLFEKRWIEINDTDEDILRLKLAKSSLGERRTGYGK